MRNALFAASLALVAGTALGCGGGGGADAPDNASTEEFCGAFQDFYTEVSEVDPEDTAAQVKALKDFGKELEELGTPEDIPDDAREGFEVTLEAIAGIPDDATEEDIDSIEDEFSEEENKQSDAFDDYLDETCGDEGPTDVPSEESSE